MITISHLTKTYGGFRAVDDVTFTAQPGRVTGFLGPNGAGKSTTMRIMVGLTPATTGEATILGRHFSELPNPGREVGVLLDASAQHAGRTGREILTLAQRTMRMPKSRVDEMLEVVSLTDEEAGRRVRDYSLGMRQRLGIAAALIGNPEVLILDEPANGLDPAGIRWMRDLLRGYADQGGTVLLSSHLLHEIEVIADDIVVIGQGRVVAQGTKHELLEAAGTYVRATDPARLAAALVAAGHPAEQSQQGLRTDASTDQVGEVALAAGIALRELRPADGAGLEEMFLALTSDTQRDRTSRRSSSMSTATIPVTTTDVGQHARAARPTYAPIPMRTIMGVELRKMFNTRSGFWLMASVVILAVIATGAVILFAPDDEHHLRQLRRRHRHPDDDRAADHRGPLDHQRVEPAHRPDDVHDGAEPQPRRAGQAARHRAGRDRLDPGRARGRRSRQRGRQPAGRRPDHLGHDRHRGPLHPRRQRSRPADGLHPRRAVPQLGRRHRRLLRLRDGAPDPVGPAGRRPGLVRRRAALGGLPVEPDRPVRRRVRPHGVGPARSSPAPSGCSSPWPSASGGCCGPR